MFKKKRLAGFFLSAALMLSFSSISFADNAQQSNETIDQNKQQALEVMQKLNEYRANKLLGEAKQDLNGGGNNIQLKTMDLTEIGLEAELENLGVKELSIEEVKQQFGNADEVSPLVVAPPSTSHIKWYTIDYTITRSGVTYNLQDLYAQGLDGGSNLAVGANGATLYSNKSVIVKNIANIGSIYAQKVIGLIPVVQWLPYELLFSSNDNVTNNSHVITHRSLSTVCFTYVKKSTDPDSYQTIGWLSNMVSVASSHTLAGYNAGSPYSKSTDKSNTTYADNYASGSNAVDYYSGVSSQTRSYISSYKFYNPDKTLSLTYYVVNPSFPAQIY